MGSLCGQIPSHVVLLWSFFNFASSQKNLTMSKLEPTTHARPHENTTTMPLELIQQQLICFKEVSYAPPVAIIIFHTTFGPCAVLRSSVLAPFVNWHECTDTSRNSRATKQSIHLPSFIFLHHAASRTSEKVNSTATKSCSSHQLSIVFPRHTISNALDLSRD